MEGSVRTALPHASVSKEPGSRRTSQAAAFTLIEIAVVIGIIVLLMAILLPSLSAARQQSKTMVCLSNLRGIGLSTALYVQDYRGTYPPSYVFPNNSGGWSIEDQDSADGLSVLHWSYLLGDQDVIDPMVFQCPEFPNGGAPRMNPGKTPADWEAAQIDQSGANQPHDLVDRQAPRMAYAMNAAIAPPNRFSTALSGGDRVNVLVREHVIPNPSGVILATEYLNDWQALSEKQGDRYRSLSHRPIDPFANLDSGFNEYRSSSDHQSFVYGSVKDPDTYGFLTTQEIRGKQNLLAVAPEVSGLNAVGRSHLTANREYNEDYGGGANFLFCDGHAETLPVLETVRRRSWGNRYYSISGANKVQSLAKQAAHHR